MKELDGINDRILRELTRNGRITNLELAEKVGLSPSACLARVQDFETSGGFQDLEASVLISGYRAVVNPVAVGKGFIAYVAVGLSDHTKAAQAEFERAMKRAPDVRECHNITGTVEYMLRVETRDLASYKNFHTEVLGTVAHVRAITSYIVMGSPKDERG